MGGLSLLGFLNPAAWLFGGLWAVLIALYLWERQRRRIDVPSLLLWQMVPEEVVRATRFRPDWLFVLQLLALTLLIAGLAHPFLHADVPGQRATRHVFVLDVSASMQAREGRHTRFDAARAAVLQRLDAMGGDDEAMLLTAAHRPRIVAPFSRDRQSLRAHLQELEPVDTGTNLDLALAIARSATERNDRPTTIEVFTDLPARDLGAEWRDAVRITSVGETDDNLALLSLEVVQPRFQALADAHAQAVVRNFSHREAHGVLSFALEGEVLSRNGFSLPPRDARSFLVRGLRQPGVLLARLEADDALASDNEARAWIRPARPLRVLAVLGASALRGQLAAIAAATPELALRMVSPQEYRAELTAEADVVIFNRFAPAGDAVRPTLYIHPPADNPYFTVRGHLTDVPLLDWSSRHPALRGLQPVAPFPFAHVQVVAAPDWTEPLLTARHGEREVPLALAGERGGVRVACLAFDLAHEPLIRPDNVSLLLFFLGLIDWLAPAADSTAVVTTGSTHTFPGLPALPRHITDPHGRVTTVSPDRLLALEPLYAGAYQIATNGTRRQVLANFFDATESDIGRASHAAPPPAPPPAAADAPPRPRYMFAPWLYVFALLVLGLEWLAAAWLE